MTSPKEDQQPMTTREELKPFVWHQLNAYEACNGTLWRTADEAMAESERAHKASRQEVSVTVEELARVIDPIAFGVKPSMYGMRPQQELKKHVFVGGARGVARYKSRALLAKYTITKRTTEG